MLDLIIGTVKLPVTEIAYFAGHPDKPGADCVKCGLECFGKRRHHLLDSVGFLGPEDAIVFASATAHEARIGVILDGVDAIEDGLISFYHFVGETNQERIFPSIAAGTLIRVLLKTQRSGFRNQSVKCRLLGGDSLVQIVNLALLLGDLRFCAGECRLGLLGSSRPHPFPPPPFSPLP